MRLNLGEVAKDLSNYEKLFSYKEGDADYQDKIQKLCGLRPPMVWPVNLHIILDRLPMQDYVWGDSDKEARPHVV